MFFRKGEIATSLTIIGVLIMAAGTVIGANLTKNTSQDVRSRAQDAGAGKLVCDAGPDPYNSNTIVVKNNTSQTITDIQSVTFKCQYEAGRIRKGYYKCETCTDSDEVGNSDCQVGVHDPSRSTEFTLAPGEEKTISVTANACETIQFDVYNPIDQGESPTECYNVNSQYINPGPPNWWPGGIGFGINENSNCSGSPQPTTPPAQPTIPPNPTSPQATQCSNEGGRCVTSTNDCQGSTLQLVGGKGCQVYCCSPKPTPSPNPNTSNCEVAFPGARCKLSCDLVTEENKGATYCGGGSLVDRTLCCAPKPTSTPRPTATTSDPYSTSQCSAQGSGAICGPIALCASGSSPNWAAVGNYGCSQQKSGYVCCVPKGAPTPTPRPGYLIPQSFDMTIDRRGCREHEVVPGYVTFICDGQIHGVPYSPPSKTNYKFLVN